MCILSTAIKSSKLEIYSLSQELLRKNKAYSWAWGCTLQCQHSGDRGSRDSRFKASLYTELVLGQPGQHRAALSQKKRKKKQPSE